MNYYLRPPKNNISIFPSLSYLGDNKMLFLNLLYEGRISVSLIVRISKSGVDMGRYRNKNLVFKIKKSGINLLFDEIYNYNYDNCYF